MHFTTDVSTDTGFISKSINFAKMNTLDSLINVLDGISMLVRKKSSNLIKVLVLKQTSHNLQFGFNFNFIFGIFLLFLNQKALSTLTYCSFAAP